jgi:hypothetical protein
VKPVATPPEDPHWRCAGCDRPLVKGPVTVSYMGHRFTTEHCPGCGLVLVPETVARGKMAEVEQLLEDK